MKRILYTVVALFAVFALAACGTLPPSPTTAQQIAIADQLSNTAAGLKQASADLHATADTIAATTQAAPAVKIPASVPQAVAKVADAAGKGSDVVQAAAVATTQPGANPVTVVIDTAKTAADTGLIPQPYGSYIQLAAILFGTGGVGAGLLGLLSGKKANASATKQSAAVQTLVDTKMLTVNPGAGAVANGIVDSHPASDALIDTLTSAAKDPLIPG